MKPLLNAERVGLEGRLEETSLSLAPGEVTCLIGPNGSGKTSLLHALTGIGGASGKVRIDGIDPRPLAPAQRQRLSSYLPASRDVHWPLAARDLIALGAPDEQARERIPALLEDFDLSALADRRIDHISTGERSRVLIARALVAEPKLLLLDEPAAGLNDSETRALMQTIHDVRDRFRIAVLLIEHNMELVMGICERIVVLNFGKTIAVGTPQEIRSNDAVVEAYLGEPAGALES